MTQLSSEGRRIARVLQQSRWELPSRRKHVSTPYSLQAVYPAFVDPDGSVWAAGRTVNSFQSQAWRMPLRSSSRALVRQVNAGSSIVFGGASRFRRCRTSPSIQEPMPFAFNLHPPITKTRLILPTNTSSKVQTRIGRSGQSRKKQTIADLALASISSAFAHTEY